MKVAVTVLAADIVTWQFPVPEQSPVQPVKVYPVPAAAVSVTGVPVAKLAEHVPPQLIPTGLEVTVPLPTLFTVSSIVGGGWMVKVWVTAGAAE